ncbi:RNA polymerase sigma factor [Neolewinella antarctica]|uniref:RNA polymerase sigma-70 factor (ECF subfamily) n=1 Tax=Neolewinella antarctica TaxID=442734 RepID=A0ABX0XBF0_9BACT|nr:RNA polymerase sigma factor [Neolewinella antarctica]NJC26603.1 RNA polymerase sigma-70 factor (ECF subfamily) [Neolewinella antarctica]
MNLKFDPPLITSPTPPARMTEKELVAACRRQDRRAQKELYDRYSRAMYTACYRICGDFETANDALQEGFLKVFQKLHTFRGDATVGAWMKVVIVRTALNKLRARKPTVDLPLNHADQELDWGTTALDTEYLEKAIAALPDGYRAVFVLIEVEGYKHQEVADMLNVTVGTSKSQLFYAKKKLREALRHYV